MGFTRPYYVKRAISKLFHMKTWYGSDPGVIARVICSRNAGIFVANDVSKLLFRSPFLYPSPHPIPLPSKEYCLCPLFLPWLMMKCATTPTEYKYRMINRSIYHSQQLRIWPEILCTRRAIARKGIQGVM